MKNPTLKKTINNKSILAQFSDAFVEGIYIWMAPLKGAWHGFVDALKHTDTSHKVH